MNPLASLALVLCILAGGRASNILMVSIWGSGSHVGFYGEMAALLADRGHQMTVISPHNLPDHQNISHIKTDTSLFRFVKNSIDLRHISNLRALQPKTDKACIDELENPKIRDLDISKFDLVLLGLHFSECLLPLIRTSKAPLVLFMPVGMTDSAHMLMGSVKFPSVDPSLSGFTKFTYPMSFKDRIWNTLIGEFSVFYYRYMSHGKQIKMCKDRGLCPEDMPSFEETESKASLLFINSVEGLQNPARPLPPNIISVGGLNCRPSKQLPEDLASWVESSGDSGFIYFSLGTAVRVSDMSPETVQAILNVFRRLKQKVIWKSDIDSHQDLPSNVKLAKWLPQQDLIGHPKCRLFITHAGLFSVMEATYHGVPILTIPVFFDQHPNSFKAENEGWSRSLELDLITEESFEESLNELLNNPKYATVAKERSIIMKDQPIPNRDLVVYWTEYVMRHNGAPFLRTPFYDMPWYRIHNFDVWAALLSAIFVVLYAVYRLCKLIIGAVYRLCKLIIGACWRRIMKKKTKQQ